MKHTKENIIKLLKKNIELLEKLEEYEIEKGNTEWITKYQRERMGCEFALNSLTDKDYFNAMASALKLEKESE